MKNVITVIALIILYGCGESFTPKDITLACSCIKSESSNGICLYEATNPNINISFSTNSISFGGKTYQNMGTTPTSFSARNETDFVVLHRGNLKVTFDYKNSREIYQCYENTI